MINIKVKLLYPDSRMPCYATSGSVAMDLFACINEEVVMTPFSRHLIPCGIAIEMPDNIEAQIRPRSGLAFKNGITVLNSPGTVDPDYRGEIKVCLINFGSDPFIITHHMRIAQMLFSLYQKANCVNFEHLSETNRSKGGFGSTGL